MTITENPHEQLSFRPRARLLQLLGDQLIGTSRLAVFELVKNAYDADAEDVQVTINKIDSTSPSITVIDNGVGMSPETVKNIWLVPAHDHREIQRKEMRRTQLNRLPLGEKGVGRFAVHKLGDSIELITRAAGQKEVVVIIDWSALIAKPFLSDATVEVITRDPEVFIGTSTGTRITITELRDRKWTRGDVRRLQRQITSISSPFASRSDRFEATLSVPEHEDWVAGVPDVEALLARAPWRFSFSFDEGRLNYDYAFRGVTGIKVAPRHVEKSNQPLQIVPERDDDTPGGRRGSRQITADTALATGIGPVTGTFYVYDRDRAILNKLGDSQLVTSFLDENGGIRVYRDGIRVYNYGETGDDWLGLDLRRVNTPTRNISRNIVVGALDLKLERSDGLKEKTNREGFVENDAYHRFRQIVLGALAVLETERKIDKDNIRILTKVGKDPETERIQKPLAELRAAASRHKLSAEMDPLINRVERDYEEMRETMLRAGLSGMNLAVVFHEIEQGVRVLYDAIESGGKPDAIQTQAKELVRILDGFSELLRKGDRKPHSLKNLVRRVRDINKIRFRTHDVRLSAPMLEEDAADIEPSFAFSLALGALNNLLDNAFYWMRFRWPEDDNPSQPKTSPRAIWMGISNDIAEGPAIVVADTGPGLQDDPDRLTRPFFSRRPDGMGVGLYYANMVMELNGGRLAFPDREDAGVPEEFDGAVIALVFPKSKGK
ncbi:ATP-binding protein [Novacetimonas hansenii]|uniref:ATP-binding protein n=1 Tax=Novacetimonas hansenii TaxID=436 RepID=UPI001CE130C3|nr:ATP-binding protein [Novacetimonas hansenii]